MKHTVRRVVSTWHPHIGESCWTKFCIAQKVKVTLGLAQLFAMAMREAACQHAADLLLISDLPRVCSTLFFCVNVTILVEAGFYFLYQSSLFDEL